MKDDFKPFRPRPAFVPVTADENQNTDNRDQAPFVPPYEVAQTDELPSPTVPVGPGPVPIKPVPGPKPKKSWKHKLNPRTWSRKQIIIVSAVVGLLIAGAGIYWFVLRDKPEPPKPAAKEEPAPAPAPTVIVSKLTGLPVTAEQAALPVTGVMIENSPDARPQAGLYDAGVVFEAIAEGGITRFLALFQESKPANIGPVRSVRPYYLDFLRPFDAPIAHAGGSGPALAEIKAQGFKDLDHGANAGAFRRAGNRFAPHNLYTTRDALLGVQNSKGWNTSNFTGFVRKSEAPHPAPNAKTIDFAISSFLYNPHYDYNAATNSYNRSEGGKPHMDELTGKQLSPKVVIALVMSHRYAGIYSVYGVNGSGKAYFFQDGMVMEGIWEKKDRASQFRFGDANGAPIGLNPGQTWISIVGTQGAVSAK